MTLMTKSKAGFSVLEIMVALAILSIGLLAIGSMFVTSTQTDEFTTSERHSDLMANAELEKWKWMAVAGIETGISVQNGRRYSRQVTVSKEPKKAGVYRVDVLVGWGGAKDCQSNPNKCKYRSRTTNFVMVP